MRQAKFFGNEKCKKKLSFLDISTILSLQRTKAVSQKVSGLYYIRRGAGYNIHMRAKLYYLGRAKVFSSVAIDFGPSTRCFTAAIRHNTSCSEVKLNLKEFLQEQRLHSERETWATDRNFDYSSLISDPGMIY